jgi:hypothetical protein
MHPEDVSGTIVKSNSNWLASPSSKVIAGAQHTLLFARTTAPLSYTSNRRVVRTVGKDHSMFRQVVMYRWGDGVSNEMKQAFRDGMESLRDIPELLAMKSGDDAGHFEGNFDFVAVMDFADFKSARDYVANPIHQAYIRDHASQVVGERVIVQHDWTE